MHQTTARRFSGFVVTALTVIVLTASLAGAAEHRRRPQSRWRQVTHASWYGSEFRGRQTADGSNFDPRRLTAAHRTLRFGTKVRVTELRTGKSVVVEINDRGPYIEGRGIDLSRAAARSLGIVNRGIARVAIELLPQELRPDVAVPTVTAATEPTVWWLPKAIVQ